MRPICTFLFGLILCTCIRVSFGSQEIPSAAPSLVESGAPAFVFFGPEAIGLESAPTELRELPDGRILVVAQREFALGDGVRWEVYHRANNQHGRTLERVAIGPDGSIYCGILGGFARLEYNEDGRWRFAQVAALSGGLAQDVDIFRSPHFIEGRWFWHNKSGTVLRWDLKGAPTQLLKTDEVEHMFYFKNNLHVAGGLKNYLHKLDEGTEQPRVSLIPLDQGVHITASSSFDEQQRLVGTHTHGVQLFDGIKLSRLVSTGILSGGRRINDLCRTQEGYFAAAVDTYGIVFFDRKGRIVQTLDRKLDQRLARVQQLLKTQDGLIWALCNDGIVRIEFPSRLSRFEQLLDTGLSHVEPFRYEGRLWFLATGQVLQGIYDEENRLIELLNQSPPAAYTFTLRAAGKHLIAGTDQGIYIYESGAWKILAAKAINARILCQDPTGRDRWLYAAVGTLGWLDFSAEGVRQEPIPSPELGMSYNAVQDAASFVWLELGLGKVARVDPKALEIKCEFFASKDGIPSTWAELYLIDGMIRMNCAGQQLNFNEQAKQWEDDRALLKRYPGLTAAAGRPTIDSRGRLWVTGPDMVRIFDTKNPQNYECLPSDLRPYHFTSEDNGVVWMHDKHRFVRYDPALPQISGRPVRAVITQIDLAVSGRTMINPKGWITDLSPSDNSIIAHFLAPGNPFGQRVTFDIKLEGSLEEWSSTGIVGSAVFNHLKPGTYILHVRPRIENTIGEVAVLSFKIPPNWYRTPLAYTLAGLLALVLISGLILLPIRYEQHQQGKLKALVAIRTRELKETNEQLKKLVDESRLKAAALEESEDRYRRLSTELEKRVAERTEELQSRIEEVETLNRDLQESHSETARAAARLQEVNANLLVANHELESFSYSVSHDLRAPLRNITGFMELLGKRVRSLNEKESDRYLDIVVSEARRMAALIDDLLTFSRVGRTEMKMQKVDLNELIQAAQREMDEDFKGREIEWRIAELPPVLGDKTLLRQVVINLLSNAVKFTRREPKAVIEIGTKPMPSSSNMAGFYVRDNGVGFNPRYMDKLFRVFQRLHTPRDFEGTGIGLANVKRIITRHGGRIWAEGAVNEGACFHFTLKLIPTVAEPNQALQTNVIESI